MYGCGLGLVEEVRMLKITVKMVVMETWMWLGGGGVVSDGKNVECFFGVVLMLRMVVIELMI